MIQDTYIEYIVDNYKSYISKDEKGFKYGWIFKMRISQDDLTRKLAGIIEDRCMLVSTAQQDYAWDAVRYFLNNFEKY